MNKALIPAMHWLVLGSLSAIIMVIILYHNDSYDYSDGSGELGNSLGYALIYTIALLVGFIGWLISIIVFVKERRAKSKHSAYAALYILIGLVGFSWAYYLIQAS